MYVIVLARVVSDENKGILFSLKCCRVVTDICKIVFAARDSWRVNTAHVSSFVSISILRGQPRLHLVVIILVY